MILATRSRPARRILASAAILAAFSGYLAPGICRHVSCREAAAVSPQAMAGNAHQDHLAAQKPTHAASSRIPAEEVSSERSDGNEAPCRVAVGCCVIPAASILEGPATLPLFSAKEQACSVALRELSSRFHPPLLPPPRA